MAASFVMSVCDVLRASLFSNSAFVIEFRNSVTHRNSQGETCTGGSIHFKKGADGRLTSTVVYTWYHGGESCMSYEYCYADRFTTCEVTIDELATTLIAMCGFDPKDVLHMSLKVYVDKGFTWKYYDFSVEDDAMIRKKSLSNAEFVARMLNKARPIVDDYRTRKAEEIAEHNARRASLIRNASRTPVVTRSSAKRQKK